MIRRLIPAAAALALATLAGCAASQNARYVTSPRSALQARGSSVIGAKLDRGRLSALVVDYINIYRSRRNLPILSTETRAAAAASWMANYQSAHSMVTHYSLDPGMRRFGDRYRQNGGGRYSVGYENAGWYPLFDPTLGRNYTYDEMARNIVDGWINSPSHHRALIVKAEGDGIIGLGVAPGTCKGTDGVFATMNVFFYMPAQELGYR